jgi:predicted RecB family endonuclease
MSRLSRFQQSHQESMLAVCSTLGNRANVVDSRQEKTLSKIPGMRPLVATRRERAAVR